MAITRMVSEKYEMVDGKYTKVAEAYPETIAEGCVLEAGIRSCQIMSDIWGSEKWAMYWDTAEGKPVHISLDVCDYNWSYGDKVHAEIDATPEVKEAYRMYRVKMQYERMLEDAKYAVKSIEKGCVAKVVRGKTSKGTQGKVIAIIKARYGMGYYSSMENKLGIATSDVTYDKALPNGKVVKAHKDVVWVWARNCERVDIAEVNEHEVWAEAEKYFPRAA